MNTIIKNILALMAFALVGTSVATAQTTFPKLKIGDNPRTLNVNAVLELESANKGFLLPRVELSATNSFAPLSSHVQGMTVYNTATNGTGATAVTPGYYYNDGTQWVRLASGADLSTVTADNGLSKIDDDIQLGGTLIKDTNITLDGNSLEIDATDSDLIISGLDKTGVQVTDGGTINEHLLAVGADNKVKALKAAMPKFFYMPSIIVPTSEEQMTASNSGAVAGDEFNNTTRQGTINLYGRYQTQFGTPMSSNTGATTDLPILPAAELDYHITWYDTSVFTSVTVTNEGLLNYTVSPTANITIGSFMNIVFAVKED